MPKLLSRSRPSRRQKLTGAGKTVVRAWPLISILRRTVGFARLGPLAVPALLGAGAWKLLRRRGRRAQEAAMPAEPFPSGAPSGASPAFTPNGSAHAGAAPDPAAPESGDDGQQMGTLPEADDTAAPARLASDESPKPDPAAPDARSPAAPNDDAVRVAMAGRI